MKWTTKKPTDEGWLCPHCGYYCTDKSIYCLPPIIKPIPEPSEDENEDN